MSPVEMIQLNIIFVLGLISNNVFCFMFHEDNTIRFQKKHLKHFGYSVFLQKGDSSSYLFVGGYKNGTEDAVSSCAIEENYCTEVPKQDTEDGSIAKLSLFGMNIDGGTNNGDPILICAPRYTKSDSKGRNKHYLSNGACYYSFDKFSNIISKVAPNTAAQQIKNGTFWYGEGQVGFSSYYDARKKEFVLGSPGLFDRKGGLYKMYESVSPIQTRQMPSRFIDYDTEQILPLEKFDEYDYAGYAVALAEFIQNRNFYVIGAPRANNLKGKVSIYEVYRGNPSPFKRFEFLGSTNGSYFGSSICVADLNGDGFPDLLIGAPFYGNMTYNEGKVYVYINKKGFGSESPYHPNQPDQQLSPTNKNSINSMFGYAMVNLGKISKEAFDVVAISSPYEENGSGYVYIYIWDKNQLKLSQKIKGKSLKAFGAGLSKPIEKDGINYFAVGAYKSSTVEILKSRPIFHYQLSVETIKYLISYEEKKTFIIKYCVSIKGVDKVKTNITLQLDRRLVYNSHHFSEEKIIEMKHFDEINVILRDKINDEITPLFFKIQVREDDCPDCFVANPRFLRTLNHKIPFIYDCGPDNICTPKLQISTNINSMEVIVGDENSLKVKVDIKSIEEYAYLCSLNMTLPDEVQFTSITKNCERDNSDCKLRNPLKKSETLSFDVSLEKLSSLTKLPQKLKFDVKVSCQNYSIDYTSIVDLKYKTKFNVQPTDASIIYDAKNITTSIKGNYSFLIENAGPSPIQNYTFTIKVPRKLNIIGDVKIFEIYKPELTGNSLTCEDQEYDIDINKEEKIKTDFDNIPDDSEVKSANFLSSSKTNEISCEDSGVECLEISCQTSLRKNELSKILIPIKPHPDQIIKFYDKTFKTTATIIYTEESKRLSKNSVLKFENKSIDEQNLWIWIVIGVFFGLLILAGVIYLFYKLHFFTRSYKIMKEDMNEKKSEALDEKQEGQEMDEIL